VHNPLPAGSGEDVAIRAAMTYRQFAALAIRCDRAKVANQLATLPYASSVCRSSTCDTGEVRKYLLNSWNTEKLLEQNRSFTGSALNNSLVWAFPQAYYSVYCGTLAFCSAAGHNQTKTHASLIKLVGELMEAEKYPHNISFRCGGGNRDNRAFKCVQTDKNRMASTLTFDPNDAATVDGQIRQFLNSTRQMDLEERLREQKLKNKAGKQKKAFSAADYDRAGGNEGWTTIMSLLYRKRLKSNYDDIEPFLSPEIKAPELFDALLRVVDCLNLTHEWLVIRCMGDAWYEQTLKSANGVQCTTVKERFELARNTRPTSFDDCPF
jgi:hypothetical protein